MSSSSRVLPVNSVLIQPFTVDVLTSYLCSPALDIYPYISLHPPTVSDVTSPGWKWLSSAVACRVGSIPLFLVRVEVFVSGPERGIRQLKGNSRRYSRAQPRFLPIIKIPPPRCWTSHVSFHFFVPSARVGDHVQSTATPYLLHFT